MTTAGRGGGHLWALAWANVALHGAGLVLASCCMRPGSPLAPLPDRLAYLATRPAGWSWGWATWMLCSLLLVAFLAALASRLPERRLAARLALLLAAGGMAVDLACDLVQIAVLPEAAAAGGAGLPLFRAAERLAFLGGATVANGLYTTAVLLLAAGMAGAGLDRAATRAAAGATVSGGALLAAAGLAEEPALGAAGTAVAIGGYSLWALLVARDLSRPAARRAAAA